MKAWRQTVILCLLTIPAVAWAQAEFDFADYAGPFPIAVSAGSFWLAVFVGVVLAVAFQLICANLSFAAGLSMLGGVTEPGEHREKSLEQREEPSAPIGKKIRRLSNAFGVWAMICTAISLFFAAWLGAEVVPLARPITGVVLGLAIWALSYVIIMVLEYRAISSMAGSLVGVAGAAARSAGHAVHTLFSKSVEDRMADAAVDVAKRVRDDVFSDAHIDSLRHEIDHYVSEIQEASDPKRLRKELAQLLSDVELHAIVKSGDALIGNKEIEVSLEANGLTHKEAEKAAQGVSEALSQIKDEAQKEDKGPADKTADAAMRVAGMSPEKAQETRQKVENYLRQTGVQALNPEGIKHDLETLLKDPSSGYEALKQRASQIDRQAIRQVLSQRQDMSPDQADKVTNTVCMVMDTISGKGGDVKRMISRKITDFVIRERGMVDKANRMRTGFMETIRQSGPESESFLHKLRGIDRETIKEMVISNSELTEEDVEKVVAKVEHARDSAVQKYDHMKSEVQRHVENARREAMHDIDETRKVAAVAAWWALAIAVVSGCAAALGGWVGIVT